MDSTRLIITNVHLPYSERTLADKLWIVECFQGRVVRVIPQEDLDSLPPDSQRNELDGQGILLPSCTHSHIHLDKCFILDRCELISGSVITLVICDFKEAMKVTAAAKANFPSDTPDLMRRGRKLIRESVECGVTSMRAHVEIDELAGFSGLDVALQLKKEVELACYVQIAAFAQEALFTNADDINPGRNYGLLVEAARREGVEAVGSAPYVEPTVEHARKNIGLIMQLATEMHLHVDFHLDYSLDPNSEPLIYEVIKQAKKRSRSKDEPERRITIGHATRLQLFTPKEWRELRDAIGDLPITFVGLPNSDLYMQGREYTEKPLGPPRGTLRVPYLSDNYGLQIAMSVNNVENAFTPNGSVDSLALCALGAAVFQAATVKDVQTLMKSVTITSKLAIGQEGLPLELYPQEGDPADFVILHGTKSLQQAVLNPAYDRTTIRNGRIVAHRRTKSWSILNQDSQPPPLAAW
ncbi:hypothetical protein D9757_003522 [Collybiopsis confluens]|uniref:Metallo-dependent hydrolase n=1 Tax=Collybiopsis confluens TaxID=2823264 RepID=A0A8H5HTH2_9AGAR|nr:hypothetical protein D9757_003522 [Collybiopsis confluens]